MIERLFGVKIFHVLPRGIDPLYDLQRLISGWQPEVIFDVGANIGQSALVYAKRFPRARVLSFEPSAETFSRLKQNLAPFANVTCFRCALGMERGCVVLLHGDDSSLNRIIKADSSEAVPASGTLETVEQRTLDEFCESHGILKIHYLKIDTEGSDLRVLRGAEQLLSHAAIEVIETEVGVGPDNELHVPLHEMKVYLEARGYRIFGFYEQVREWKWQRPHLRRTNVVFISKELNCARGQRKLASQA